MKQFLILPLLFLALVAQPAFGLDLSKQDQKVGYAIGLSIGGDLKRQGFAIDAKALNKGMEDALKGRKPMMTDQQIKDTMQALRKQAYEKRAKEQGVAAKANLAKGNKFLAKNKKKKGVITTKSGLQYKVIKKGKGKSPKKSDKVLTHYRGTLINGTEFDSSYKRKKPATFGVGQVIPGWTEALQKMKTGAKWKLFVPAKLAYGKRGAGKMIPPNSTLIFDIELIEIKKPTAKKKK